MYEDFATGNAPKKPPDLDSPAVSIGFLFWQCKLYSWLC